MGIGAGATVLLLQTDRTPPKTQAERVDRFTERIADSLELDEQQTEQLHDIIQERMQEVDRIFRQVKPEMQQQLRLLDEQIRATLPPEKTIRWERFYQERFNRWKDDAPAESTNGASVPATDSHDDSAIGDADRPTTK
jgi:hypothetical protein